MDATKPHWGYVYVSSGNGLTLSKSWPISMSSYGVMDPQWITGMTRDVLLTACTEELTQSWWEWLLMPLRPITHTGRAWDDFSTLHYSGVIMSAMASQITGVTIVYSNIYSGADQRKLASSASLAIVWGINRWPVNSPHKGPETWKFVSIWWRHRDIYIWQPSDASSAPKPHFE